MDLSDPPTFLPLLPSPPLPFAVKFQDGDDPGAASSSTSLQKGKEVVTWPKEEEEGHPVAHTATPAWDIKTAQEHYLSTLESKLDLVKAGISMAQSSSKTDSGYASSSRTTISPPPADSPKYAQHHDLDLSVREEDLEDEMEEAVKYGLNEEGGAEDDAIESEALLPSEIGSKKSVSVEQLRQLRGYEGAVLGEASSSGNEGDHDHSHDNDEPDPHTPHESSSPSHSYFHLIPPTPESLSRVNESGEAEPDPDEEEDAEDAAIHTSDHHATDQRRPANASSEIQNRRISFNNSVRISGGIKPKPKSKPQRKRALPPDLFTPSAAPNERTRLVPTSGTTPPSTRSYIPHHPSRNTSPNSSAFHTRTTSTGSLYLLQSGYSSAGTSAVPSRASSPASSIYAPLQPPSMTCPSPINTRPPVRKVSINRRPLTFREYLRGRRDDSEEEEEVTYIGGMNGSSGTTGYRALLDAERRKKLKLDPRTGRVLRGKGRKDRRDGEEQDKTLWEWFVDLLSASAGPRGGMMFIPPSGSGMGPTPYSHGGPRRGRRSGSRDSEGRRKSPRSALAGKGVSSPVNAQGRRLKRTSSSLSHSSISDDADDESEGAPTADEAWGGLGDEARSDDDQKSEVNVRFGSAPQRWVTMEWWGWRLSQVGKGFASVFGECFGRQKDKGRNNEEERGAYQNV